VASTVVVKIPLNEVEKDWRRESAARHMQILAEHYGVYQDLFNGNYFTPVVNLHIFYDSDNDLVTPVYYGNRILPAEVTLQIPFALLSLEYSLFVLLWLFGYCK